MRTTPRSTEPFSRRITTLIVFLAVLWAVEFVNALQDHELNMWGILPRERSGLRGIPLAPFLHGDYQHLMLNSVPLAVLGWLILLRGTRTFLGLTATITLLAGAGVWCFGRKSYHIGASALVLGYFGYLVARAFYERSVGAFIIATLTVALYGGLFFSVFPSQPGVSWEGHLFGLLAGITAASSSAPRRASLRASLRASRKKR